MNKYLRNDPLPILLENSNPIVRHLTIKEICAENRDAVDASYREMKNSQPVQCIFSAEEDGVLGNKPQFDSYNRGAAWLFAKAITFGFDRRESAIEKTAEFIFGNLQCDSGGFTRNWRPRAEDACMTGEMIKYLTLAGYNDNRIQKGVRWIIDHQRHDGGWTHSPVAGYPGIIKHLLFKKSGNGIVHDANPETGSCFYASIACAMALAVCHGKIHDCSESIEKAADFFLSNRMIFSPSLSVITPANISHRTKNALRVGYPVLFQYDILYVLLFIAMAGRLDDRRTGEAFNAIMSKQTDKGIIEYEIFREGMLFNTCKGASRRAVNKWPTLNLLRLFKHAE